VIVQTAVIQFADGSIDDGGVYQQPGMHIDVDSGRVLSLAQARELIAIPTEAIGEIERWSTA